MLVEIPDLFFFRPIYIVIDNGSRKTKINMVMLRRCLVCVRELDNYPFILSAHPKTVKRYNTPSN